MVDQEGIITTNPCAELNIDATLAKQDFAELRKGFEKLKNYTDDIVELRKTVPMYLMADTPTCSVYVRVYHKPNLVVMDIYVCNDETGEIAHSEKIYHPKEPVDFSRLLEPYRHIKIEGFLKGIGLLRSSCVNL